MATSGKTSSVAALLLLVAVLAGSCATGANANYNVTNSCNRNVTLLDVKVNASALANVVVYPGTTVTLVGSLLHNLKIVVGGHTYTLLVADIQALLKVNLNAVAKIEIVCNGVCGPNALTINVYVTVLGVLQLVGHVCASLVV